MTLDDRVEHAGDRDIASWRPLRGNSKNRHMEEVVKRHFLHDQVQSGTTANGQETMRSHGIREGTGRRWMQRQVRSYVGGAWRLPELQKLSTVGMVLDCARFGQPAKETLVVSLSCGLSGYGMWLPPQDK